MKRVLEWTLNLLCLVLVGLSVAAYFKSRRPPSPPNDQQARIKLGQHLIIPSVNWGGHRNLVFALSTTCHFCEESAPFYRKLLLQQVSGSWKPVFLFPQSSDQATAYIAKHQYTVSTAAHTDYTKLGINGTPTLILVDQDGAVLNEWIGRLTPKEEADVAIHLGIDPTKISDDNASNSGHWSLEVVNSELAAIVAGRVKATILDVRDRQLYGHSHIPGSVNIPYDELSTRASHEISVRNPVVLYCNFSPSCQANGLRSLCSVAADALNEAGIKDVHYIRETLEQLDRDDFPLVKDVIASSR